MKRVHSVTTLAVAGAMSVGVVTAGATAAQAATRPAPATATSSQRAYAGAPIKSASARTIGDDVFRVTRLVSNRAGSSRVIFCATDLRTGRTVRLN
jgi:hypothetical protein